MMRAYLKSSWYGLDCGFFSTKSLYQACTIAFTPYPPSLQGSPRLRVDSPGELRLVSNPGRPKAGRKPPGPGVLRMRFLTRGSPVPGHQFMHRSRASPAFGRANSTQSGHPGDTGAVLGDWPGPCSTGHLGSRWKVAG